MATMEMNVGPEGGRYHSGSLSVLIPDGAVSERVNIKMYLYVDERLMPPSSKVTDEYVLSPLFVFELHGLTFSTHVQVHCPPLVDSRGWRLSLMRAMCDISASSQLWQSEVIVTITSDVNQVNVEDSDSEYDLASGTLSIKQFCWFCYQPRSLLNIWNLNMHCHDNCHELIEQRKRDENGLSPKRHLLCLKEEMKVKFEGNIEFSITRGDWKALSQLSGAQPVAAVEFWNKWICLDKKFQITVEFEHVTDHRSNRCCVDITQGGSDTPYGDRKPSDSASAAHFSKMPQTSLLPILEDRALEGRYSDALQALRLQGCASHASSETLEESLWTSSQEVVSALEAFPKGSSPGYSHL
ncbi:uncharacterized protein LOC134190408 [Corticium candelabrum]|uniref:uncharacterized protein LOC134190408 n=1 Tax=Corticium candelabrum TaxID=121492 RepID=UPI002E2723AB|nr:uncharacterized protein LOC134190408 [Corticium candelabrum]